jgi:outer membrane protein OmpA-like peptidoglycan-associated protein
MALLSLGLLAHTARADGPIPFTLPPGFYIGGGIGANLEEDNRFRGGGTDATVSYGAGLTGIGTFGYSLGNGIRVELEPGYRNNEVDHINGAPGSGRTQLLTVMANVLYDFNYVTPYFPLHPHLGVGVGYAHAWNRSGSQNGLTVSGQDDVPAFQGIAGVEYALNPNDHVGLDYHYLVAHDVSFRASNGLESRAGDLNNHTFLITFRHQFGAPPPPPPPTPAITPAAPPPAAAVPPAPRPFEVYFEFDRATLTPDARAVVNQAAQNAKQGQATRIIATGHTDTVGSARYNQALSVRRANAVRAALIEDGIAPNQIETRGVGKNELAVPTADNVNEPRNRRVEIIIQAPGM